MDIDQLRRAAAKLREHAQAVKPGPWEVDHDDMWFTLRTRHPVQYGYEADIVDVHSPDDTWADFDYFALMHPPVALALAELLDAEAALCRPNTVPASEAGARRLTALSALARAVLREGGA